MKKVFVSFKSSIVKTGKQSGDKSATFCTFKVLSVTGQRWRKWKSGLTQSRSTLSVVKVQTHLVLTEVCLCPGESGLCELCESLLRGHRGGDEGNLHIQPHLEAVWRLHSGHGPGNIILMEQLTYTETKDWLRNSLITLSVINTDVYKDEWHVSVLFFFFCRFVTSERSDFLIPSWRNTSSTWCLTPSTPSSAPRSLRTARLCRSGPRCTVVMTCL